MNFRTVSHGFDLKFLDKVYMAVDRIRNIDISEITLRMENAKFGGYFADERNELVFSRSVTEMDELDSAFVAIHEVRHIWQSQAKKMVQKHGLIEWTETGYKIGGREMMHATYYDSVKYLQFPWEADANGFAWHMLNKYSPENDMIRESIQYSTVPPEYQKAVKTRTKKKLNGFSISDDLLHRSS